MRMIDSFFAMDEDEFIGKAGRDFGVFYSQVNRLAVGKTQSKKEHSVWD